jgi:hypothetical protein
MLTVIDKNGAFQREIYTKADSAFFEGDTSKNPFLFDIDSKWNLSRQTEEKYEFPNIKKLIQIAKISAKFNSFEVYDCLNFYKKTRALSNPKETFDKKFRWFFTIYSFTADYKQFTETFLVPLDKYMTEEEQSIWFRGDIGKFAGWNGYEIKEYLDEIDAKFGKWYLNYCFEVNYNSIYNTLKNKNTKYLEPMIEIKDSLFQTNFKNFKHKENSFELADLITMLDTFFQTSDFTNLYNEFGSDIKKYSQQFFYEDALIPIINYQLIMPGTVTETNASLISGDTLKWRVDILRILPSDHKLLATSRSVNVWAFAITALFVLTLIFWIIKKIHKTR